MEIEARRARGFCPFLVGLYCLLSAIRAWGQQGGSISGVSVLSAGRAGAGSAAADSLMESAQNPAALGFFFGDGLHQPRNGAAEYTLRLVASASKGKSRAGRPFRNEDFWGGGGWPGWATALDDSTFFGISFLPGIFGRAEVERRTRPNVGVGRDARILETRASLLQVGVHPAVSWRSGKNWSFGVGATIRHTRIGIQGATEINTLETFQGESSLGGTWGEFFTENLGIPEIQTEYDGDANSLLIGHLQFGAMWAPRPDTQLSFWYRTPSTRSDLDGTVDANLNPDIGPIVRFFDLSARGDYDLALRDIAFPQQIGIAGTHIASETDRWHMDFIWTDWSSTFDGLTAFLTNPTNTDFNNLIGGSGATDFDLNLRWKDTYTFSVGYEHDFSSDFTVRGGVGYQTNPAVGTVSPGTVVFNAWTVALGATLWGDGRSGDWHLALVATVPRTYQAGNNELLEDFSYDRYRLGFYSLALAYSLNW